MGAAEEDVVRAFLRATEGRTQDIAGMTALMGDDFEYQMNTPLATPVRGRDAMGSELERQNNISTGVLPGSEILRIASDGTTVFTERRDVFEMSGKRIILHINTVFEVRDTKIALWREYFDSFDLGQQLGVDPALFYR